MKNSKGTVSAMVTLMAFVTMTSDVFASRGENIEHGEQEYYYGEQSNMERSSYQGQRRGMMMRSREDDHHENMVNDLVTAEERLANPLTSKEKEMLIYGQQEERLAKEVYEKMYKSYGLNVFNNISMSEGCHVEAMGSLLTAYGLPQTEGYGTLQSTYDDLVAKGALSLKDAIEVGITIEILDIKDLDTVLASTDRDDIKVIYERLRQASIKHLNAFVRTLQQNGFETDLNWQQYTNQEAVNSKRGKGGKKGRNERGKWRKDHDNMEHSKQGHGRGLEQGHGKNRFNNLDHEFEDEGEDEDLDGNNNRKFNKKRGVGQGKGRGLKMQSNIALQYLNYRKTQRPWTDEEREERTRKQSPKKANYGRQMKERRGTIRMEFKADMESLRSQRDNREITEEEFKKNKKEKQKEYRVNLRKMRKSLKIACKAEKE